MEGILIALMIGLISLLIIAWKQESRQDRIDEILSNTRLLIKRPSGLKVLHPRTIKRIGKGGRK